MVLGSVDTSTQPNKGRDETEHAHEVAYGLFITGKCPSRSILGQVTFLVDKPIS